MGVNQVKFGDATVIDISDSTVAPETLLSGVTAYNKAGNKIVGEVVVEHVEVEPVLETGTKSATITVGEESTDIYCENTKAEVKNMKTTQSATITNGIAQFECIDKNFVKALKLTMEPIQDLHGYDHPWAGGAGKNKLPMTVASIKALNTGGTWNDNVYTFNGGTFTILTDADNNVIGIKINGTFNAESLFYLTGIIENNGYIINGCTNGSSTSYRYRIQYFTPSSLVVQHTQHATNGDYTLHEPNVPDESWNRIRIFIFAANGYTADNVLFYPMIRLITEIDATFAPYSNICPISGRTEASVTRTGKNSLDKSNLVQGSIQAIGTDSVSTTRVRSGYVKVFPNTVYTISTHNSDNLIVNFHGYSEPNTESIQRPTQTYNVQSLTITTGSGVNYIRILFRNAQGTTIIPSDILTPMLEIGSVATDYEPYVTPETYTHKYGQEVIGGTDNFVNGGLDNEYELFEPTTVTTVAQGYGIWYWAFSLPKSSTNILSANGLRCSHFKPTDQVFAIGNCYITANGTLFVCVPSDQTLNTGALVNAWLAENDLQFAYKPTTQTTIETSAEKITTLPGVNVISATEPISECSYRVLEENLSDTIYSNETLVGEDSDVYTFRTAPDISDANYVEENMVGGSVIWNQIIQYAKATYVTENGLTVTNNGDNTVSISGTTNATGMAVLTERVTVPRKDHVVLYMLNKVIGYNWGISGYGATAGSADKRFLFFKRNNTTDWLGAIQCSIGINVTVDVKNVRCSMIDLTRMFGNTGVADYIYTLEQATSGAGIEFLQSYGFFTQDYYDYDAGSLQSVNFNKWFKTGKNLFNPNRMQGVNNIIDGNDVYVRLNKNAVQYFHDYKSYIPGNRTYTLQFDPPSDLSWTYASLRCRLKDNSDYGNVGAIDGWTYQNASKSYYQTFENASHVEVTATIPDCLYCEFGIGTNNWFENIKETGTYVKFSNIQLEVGSEATDYEPYEGYEISLDDDLDLRGLFKISDNKLVADGDIYEGDGKITRKYGVIDLGTLTWLSEDSSFLGVARVNSIQIEPLGIKWASIPLCSLYKGVLHKGYNAFEYGEIGLSNAETAPQLRCRSEAFIGKTNEEIKAMMSGVILLYELAEPILNAETGFDSPQVFIPNGNEYFVKTYTSTPDRDFDVPAGHVGKYYGKSMSKEISLPTIPKSGGTYILKCNVLADGNKKLYWCADNN